MNPTSDQDELKPLRELRAVLGQLRDLGAAAPRPSTPLEDPPFEEVVSGLGYLVALQRSPEVGPALTAGMRVAVLKSLQAVVHRWIVEHTGERARPAAPIKPSTEAVGFLEKTSEHLRFLGE